MTMKSETPKEPTAPVRTDAERKKWREDFFREHSKLPPERLAKVRAMIAPWPTAKQRPTK